MILDMRDAMAFHELLRDMLLMYKLGQESNVPDQPRAPVTGPAKALATAESTSRSGESCAPRQQTIEVRGRVGSEDINFEV